MMEAGYAVTLSFKEVLADLIEQSRCSFNPRNWMSYSGSTPRRWRATSPASTWR